MKERLIYVDQIRGIAILLVIMGHLIENTIGQNSVFYCIHSFHMPLFFIISGYIGFKTVKIDSLKSYGVFLKKKFTTLMIPFLFWLLIVHKYFFSEGWTSLSIHDVISSIIAWNPLWFLKNLFLIFVLFGIWIWGGNVFYVNKMRFQKRFIDILMLLAVLCLLGLSAIFIDKGFFSSLLLYTLFFYMGVFISKYKAIENFIRTSWVFESCLVLFMILIGHWVYGGDMLDDLYKIIISLSFFIAILNICRRTVWNPFISNQVVTFGKYSLAIYVVHFCLINVFDGKIAIEINPFLCFVVFAIIAIGIGYLCIGFAKIIEKAPVLNFLMFGK